MANAVIARNQGDEYQARYFWVEACRLFQSYSKVERVAYEFDEARAFDDVVVFYSEPIGDERGHKITADYYQIKYHLSHNGAFSCDSLIDPAFINANSVSLLQRLHNAQQLLAPEGRGCRFTVLSPWIIQPDDPLAELISNNRGQLRLDKLYDGTGLRGAMGQVREKWRRHLELESEDALAMVLNPLRIEAGYWGLERLNEMLSDRLTLAGMLPVPSGQVHQPYDDLIRKLKAQGRNIFGREDLQRILTGEGLWRGHSSEPDTAVQIGIRSFLRRAEHMEDETVEMLDLVPHFEGRYIRDTSLWRDAIFSQVRGFLAKYEATTRRHHLLLDAHASIAFAAGYCLEVKSSANVMPVQKFQNRTQVWDPRQTANSSSYTGWINNDYATGSGGSDVAIAISITHKVLDDVTVYVARHLPHVGRIIECYPEPEPSSTAIIDAGHAYWLAQKLAAILKLRAASERSATVHLFAAAPNAFMFFLGQMARSFGACVCYEFDFDTSKPGAYQPSIRFPPPSHTTQQ